MESTNEQYKVESYLAMWKVDKEGRIKREKEVRFCPDI